MNVVNIFLLDRPKNKSEINIIIATTSQMLKLALKHIGL